MFMRLFGTLVGLVWSACSETICGMVVLDLIPYWALSLHPLVHARSPQMVQTQKKACPYNVHHVGCEMETCRARSCAATGTWSKFQAQCERIDQRQGRSCRPAERTVQSRSRASKGNCKNHKRKASNLCLHERCICMCMFRILYTKRKSNVIYICVYIRYT